ncbi:hypothetical protein K7W42_16750, partial [Deinococcus sp. HMF7604]|uniref:hypothetical protein n=1 Tax=Deinococcus betulae TaxID=2873312 RepID=UPI001CCCC73F
VLYMNSPQNILPKPQDFALDAWPLNTNSRLLMAAFGQRGGSSRLAFQSRVIPRCEVATMDDPLAGLTCDPEASH